VATAICTELISWIALLALINGCSIDLGLAGLTTSTMALSTRPWRAFFSVYVKVKARVALRALTISRSGCKHFADFACSPSTNSADQWFALLLSSQLIPGVAG